MRLIWKLSLLLLLGGCFLGRDLDDAVARSNDPNRALIVGYLDTSAASYKITSVILKQASPFTEKPYWTAIVQPSGVFGLKDIPVGSYQIYCLGGANVESCYPEYGRNETAIKLEAPGVYYLGAWRYVAYQKKGFFGARSFDLEKISSPTSAEALSLYLPLLKGTRWYSTVQTLTTEPKP